MPNGLEHLKRGGAYAIPWAWGINGIFTVLGGGYDFQWRSEPL